MTSRGPLRGIDVSRHLDSDTGARVSFAVIAVLLLVGATASGVYMYSLQSDLDEGMEVPHAPFNSVIRAVETEARGMARSSLDKPMELWEEAVDDPAPGELSSLIMDYRTAAEDAFEKAVSERYNGTQVREGIHVAVETIPPPDGTPVVFARYDNVTLLSEAGEIRKSVPVGFGMDAYLRITLEDRNSTTRQVHISRIGASSSTDIPAVISVLSCIDMTALREITGTMMWTLAMVKVHGKWDGLISIDKYELPDPYEELEEPEFAREEGFGLGFGSDIGLLSDLEVLTSMDLEIVRKTSLLLLQLRYLGMWDPALAESLVQDIRYYGLSREADFYTVEDLEGLVGRGYPNYVNIELLTLELFGVMDRLPESVNMAGPQLRKMMDEGFMSLLGNDWENLVREQMPVPSDVVANMFNPVNYLTWNSVPQSIFLLSGYGGLLAQFMAMILFNVLEAYHLDEGDEVEAFVEALMEEILDETFLKFIPEKVSIPPGDDPLIEIDLRGEVNKAAKATVNLFKARKVDLLGLEMNGYTLIYLYLCFQERTDVDEDVLELAYEKVYDDWLDKLDLFITDLKLDFLDSKITDEYYTFMANLDSLRDEITEMEGLDLSMNSTLDASLEGVLDILDDMEADLSLAEGPMANSTAFFVYGEGCETDEWLVVDDVVDGTREGLTALEDSMQEFGDLLERNQASSPEHEAAQDAHDLMEHAWSSVKGSEGAMKVQLDIKWERDLLRTCREKIEDLGPGEENVSVRLYEVVGLLSRRIGDHDPAGFEGSVDDLATDLGNASMGAKGIVVREGSMDKDSVKSILKKAKGMEGIKDVIVDILEDLRVPFVGDMMEIARVPIPDGENETAGFTNREEANERLLLDAFRRSVAALEIERNSLGVKIVETGHSTPLEILNSDGDFSPYYSKARLETRAYVLDALLAKLAALEDVYASQERYPAMVATFDHIRWSPDQGEDGETGPVVPPVRDRSGFRPLPFGNISLNQSVGSGVTAAGLRLFNNTSSRAVDDIVFQYLNPFSKDWFDYYLSTIVLTYDWSIELSLDINDTRRLGPDGRERHYRGTRSMAHNSSVAATFPSPLPALDVRYTAVAAVSKRPRNVNLDRNIFTSSIKSANVTFSYDVPEDVDGDGPGTGFRLQVTGNVETGKPSGPVGGFNLFSSLFDPVGAGMGPLGNWRSLTDVMEVSDNGDGDTDPRMGQVRAPVSLTIGNLKTDLPGGELKDCEPLLFVRVWRPMDYKALMSSTALRSVAGEEELYQPLPFTEVKEQGFVYFEEEKDAVIPVFDVGEGDREVDVRAPMDGGTTTINYAVLDSDPDNDRYPDRDPVYRLTCRFDLITDIPPDSMIFFNDGVPLLVDFDNGHMWIRDLHLGYTSFFKDISAFEESLVFGVLPDQSSDWVLNRMLPSSEYKFARVHDFIPIYMQYFQGYNPPPSMEDLASGDRISMSWMPDPDLFHMPYRAMPINVLRSRVVSSLWSALLEEMDEGHRSLNLFVPDIYGWMMREVNDLGALMGGLVVDGTAGTSSSGPDGGLSEALETLGQIGSYSNLLEDLSDITGGGTKIRLSTPGAREEYALGNQLYLGFDVARNRPLWFGREVDAGSLVMLMMGLVGYYYDTKVGMRMGVEIAGLLAMATGVAGGAASGGEAAASGSKVMGYLTRANEIFTRYNDIIMAFLASVKEYKALLEGEHARVGPDYLPALFEVRRAYNLSDGTLREYGDLAWGNGYDVADVAHLIERNGFGMDDITGLRMVQGLDGEAVSGLACIHDLEPGLQKKFVGTFRELGIGPEEYCAFGENRRTEWLRMIPLLEAGLDKDLLKRAAGLGFGFPLIRELSAGSEDIEGLVNMAANLSSSAGYPEVMDGLNNGTDGPLILKVAHRLRVRWEEDEQKGSIFFRPLGRDGPDIYTYPTLYFVFNASSSLKGTEDVVPYLTEVMTSVRSRAFKDSVVYLEVNGSVGKDVFRALRRECLDLFDDLDPEGRVTEIDIVAPEKSVSIVRWGDELVRIP